MVSIVGREAELASIRGGVGSEGGVHGLVLVGDPGIGKTMLWEAGVTAARERGARVLVSRPGESEARLPFAGLIDLCEHVSSDEFGTLPGPQRRALEAALLRLEPMDSSAQAGAVEFGFVAAVRALATGGPLVIAVDDLQWLDRASADVLAFAARRLRDVSVGFLLARRPAGATDLERALEHGSVVRVQVGALTLGAVRRMLRDRLGLAVSRPLLRRVVEVTQGNPLFALEIGRSLLEQEAQDDAADVPLPESVEELVGDRVAELAPGARTVLLATALSEDLRASMLSAVAGPDAVEDALQAGVLVLDGERVRAAHPLLAAVASKRSGVRERRELHRALAGVVDDGPLRALHLALASTGANEDLAGKLAAGAREASARGARQQAVELARHALRLTAADSGTRGSRVLGLAAALYEAGDLRHLTKLVSEELESLPTGTMRARARLLLGEGYGAQSLDDADDQLELGLVEAAEDRPLRAYLLAKRAANTAAGRVARIGEAEAWALEALADADRRDVERVALYALAWARALTARPVDDLCTRSDVEADTGAYLAASPERVASQRQIWRGEIPQAREALARLLAVADERGEEASYVLVRLHICELHLRAGEWDAAGSLLDEWAESSNRKLTFRPQYERCRALLAAGRGDDAGATRWANDAISRAQAAACRWDELEAQRARGVAGLRAGAPELAVQDFAAVWDHIQREGILELGAFPVAPELVEALVELDRIEDARTVTGQLAQLAKRHKHPWAIAGAKRSRALLRAGSDQSAAMLRAAADNFEQLGLRFDAARSLLALGRAQRRAKQWRAARDALASAAGAFERLGSPGWAERAREEHGRVPGRRRARSGELTPTERRVVELAAEGLANKQIATTLFVAVHTVEVHLAHAYAKLGVRSRSQLAARLVDDGRSDGSAAVASPKE
jgi:DNA-binding CsgD family transcriptional regulator